MPTPSGSAFREIYTIDDHNFNEILNVRIHNTPIRLNTTGSGALIFNTATGQFEGYNGASWISFGAVQSVNGQTGSVLITEIDPVWQSERPNYHTKLEISASLALKVDKISGKGLSTEDYTAAGARSLFSSSPPLLYNTGSGQFFLPKATGSGDGYLSAADWNSFNAKQSALGYTPENVANRVITLASATNFTYPSTLLVSSSLVAEQSARQTAVGNISSSLGSVSQSLAIHVVNTSNPHQVTAPQVGAYTTAQVDALIAPKIDSATARLLFSATIPLAYNTGSGQFSMPKATGSVDGYLAASDWNAFNQKQAVLGYTPLNPSNNLSDVGNVATARANLGTNNAANLTSGIIPTGRLPAFVGDVTSPSGSNVLTIPTASIDNGKLAVVPANTFKGNNSVGTNTPVDLTVEQAKSMLALTVTDVAGSAPSTSPTFSGTASFVTGSRIDFYNTADRTTNYERLTGKWVGNQYLFGTEYGGSGSPRTLRVGLAATANSDINRFIQFSAGTPFISYSWSSTGLAGYAMNLGGNQQFVGSSVAQGAFSITPTITQTGTAGYTAFAVIPFEQTVGSGSRHLIRVGTSTAADGGGTITDRFVVTSAGSIQLGGSVTPLTDNTWAFGTTALRFSQIHGTRLSIGDGSALDTNAIAQFTATNRFVLFPRIASSTIAGMTSPVDGLFGYQNDGTVGFYGRIGGSWLRFLTNNDVGTIATQNADGVNITGSANLDALSRGVTANTSDNSTLLATTAFVKAQNYQSALGYTPLNSANNLSDIASPGTARTNLGLGTASTLNAPVSGDAGSSEVVKGDDTRLTNARTPTTHTHSAADITSGTLGADRLATGTGLQVLRRNSGNTALEFATISTGGGDLLAANNLSDLTDAAAARTNIGAAPIDSPTFTGTPNISNTAGLRIAGTGTNTNTFDIAPGIASGFDRADWKAVTSNRGMQFQLSPNGTSTATKIALANAAGSTNFGSLYIDVAGTTASLGSQNVGSPTSTVGMLILPNWTTINFSSGTVNFVNAPTFGNPVSVRTNLGLGTISVQNSASVSVTGSALLTGSFNADALSRGVTPTLSDNSTLLATTAFVKGQNYQAALGYTPLNAANNLNDVANASISRQNLGSDNAANLTSGSIPTARYAVGSIPLASLATQAAQTFVANGSGSAATPTPLTVAQAKTLLAIATNDVSGLGTMATQNANAVSITGSAIITGSANLDGSSRGITANTADNSTLLATTAFIKAQNYQASLGYTPLNPTNNLSDVSSTPVARTNLGLGTVSVQNSGSVSITGSAVLTGSFNADALSRGVTPTLADNSTLLATTAFVKGQNYQAALGYTPLNAASNLSDVGNIPISRQNLGSDNATNLTSGSIPTGRFAAGTVPLASLATQAASTFVANGSGSVATPTPITVAQAKTLLSISTSDVFGLGTIATQNANTVSITGSANLDTLSRGVTATLSDNSTLLATTAFVKGQNYQSSLGYTPLNASSNLGDVANAVISRQNLGSDNASNLTSGSIPTGRFAAGTVPLVSLTTQAASTFVANASGSVATPTPITVVQAKTLLSISTSDVSGLGTLATQNANAASITGSANLDALSRGVTAISSDNSNLLATTAFVKGQNYQAALGYTPLNPANNLGDVSNSPISRQNIGADNATNLISGSIPTGRFAAGTVPLTALSAQAAQTFVANSAGGSASPVAVSAATAKSLLAITTSDVSGLGTAATVNTGTTGATIPLLSGNNTWSGTNRFANSGGIRISDTDDSHVLQIVVGSNLTANRNLSITTGDADRTLTMSGNATISGTNTGDQDLSGLMVKSSNLSDVVSPVVARQNLGADNASNLTSGSIPTGRFAAATIPLSTLTQSGATFGQMAMWDGSAWVPVTPSGSGGGGGGGYETVQATGSSFTQRSILNFGPSFTVSDSSSPARTNVGRKLPVETLYTTPGTYSYAIPDGATMVLIGAMGAGGGGGGGRGNGGTIGGGGGGGGGAYVERWFRVDELVSPIQVIVGAGGNSGSGGNSSGGAASAGLSGGSTSVTSSGTTVLFAVAGTGGGAGSASGGSAGAGGSFGIATLFGAGGSAGTTTAAVAGGTVGPMGGGGGGGGAGLSGDKVGGNGGLGMAFRNSTTLGAGLTSTGGGATGGLAGGAPSVVTTGSSATTSASGGGGGGSSSAMVAPGKGGDGFQGGGGGGGGAAGATIGGANGGKGGDGFVEITAYF